METVKAPLLGLRIKALQPDMDCDEYDNWREIPAGSLGTVSRVNHIDGSGNVHYDIEWDNGAWTVYSVSEIWGVLEVVSGRVRQALAWEESLFTLNWSLRSKIRSLFE